MSEANFLKAHTMTLHSYNRERTAQPFEFYILCKGNNSGRPMATACPNCFSCVCDSPEEKDFYFWLCFGLWKAKHFHPYLFGSVIPYIRISDCKKILQLQAGMVDRLAWMATVQKVLALEAHEKNIRQQLQLLNSMKVAIIRQHIRQ